MVYVSEHYEVVSNRWWYIHTHTHTHTHKDTRTRGVKRQAAVRVSDSDSGSDRPTVIRHRRRGMRNAPMNIPDPEPD